MIVYFLTICLSIIHEPPVRNNKQIMNFFEKKLLLLFSKEMSILDKRKEWRAAMKKTKRILALIGVILLVGMYLSTLVFALMKHENASNMLMASIICTVIIPVLLYAYTLMYRVLDRRNDKTEKDSVKKP